MSRFDTFIVVDWSAGLAKSARPQKDAIWIGIVAEGTAEEPVYCRSRRDAEAWLVERFDREMESGRRTLACFDFPFGYPRGFARAICGSDDPLVLWDWLEARITDGTDGRNNRFEVAEAINARFPDPGPFWGKQNRSVHPGVPYEKKTVRFADFAERRETDRVSKAASSCFQLAFPPTVGGQVLTGLPVLARLRRRAGVAVWPFEETDDALVVLAEIWPGVIEPAVPKDKGRIRDRDQVDLLALALSRLPEDRLHHMMKVPEVAREEAWILGGDDPAPLLEALSPRPPPLTNDCFALPPGVDWTPVDTALSRLRRALRPVTGTLTVPLSEADGRILSRDHVAPRANPPAPNAAVDGYGFAHAALTGGDAVLPLVEGRAAAGAPYPLEVPPGHAIRILTGAVLPQGVDTVVLEEDTRVAAGQVAFHAPKPGANTRKSGEDVPAGAVALHAGIRLGPPDLALAAAVGLPGLDVHEPLRVAVLSTGSELADPDPGTDPARTHDANRPMLLALLRRWGFEPVDLGRAEDDRTLIRDRFDAAASGDHALLTSGGASAGDEDHVSALLKETGSLTDWRIALKPGRPLALGVWNGCPVFGLPGNPVAALVCSLIFVRPALFRLAGAPWQEAQGFPVPAAFSKSKKPGRREYLRARLNADGHAEVFPSEGSGRISGLAWAGGLVELGDAAQEITPGDPVRFLPYASFGLG